MAGDFTKPTVNSTYVNYPVEIRDMFADLVKMLDGTTTTNIPDGAIKWNNANGRFEKKVAGTFGALISKYMIDVDTVDGYHAGNGTGAIPVSNGTVCTNLNADMLDGLHMGNSSGQIPRSNGTVCTNLNADMLDGYNAGNGSGAIPINNGTLNTNLNADMLDGYHASSFAQLSGATFVGGRVVSKSDSQTGYSSSALESYCDVGNALFTLHAAGSTAAVIQHLRGGSGIRVFDASMSAAPVYASFFQQFSERSGKTSIRPMASGALERVLSWKLYDYEYKAQRGVPQCGPMADEADSRICNGEALNILAMLSELAGAVQEMAGVR